MENIESKAFTLIELIVVMAIIAVLVLLAAPRFLGYNKEAKVTTMKQDLRILSDASELSYVNEGEWPILDNQDPFYLGYGGIKELYPLDESKIESSIKNIKGGIGDYGLVIDGKHKGQVFHMDGVEGGNDELIFGGNIKLPNYSAIAKPQTKPGLNLVINGDGSYGDNTNFERLIYDKSVQYNDYPSFHNGGEYLSVVKSKGVTPVDANKTYRMSYSVKASKGDLSRTYGMVVAYDIDQNIILPANFSYIEGTLTKLREDLKPGDTTVYLENVTNWLDTPSSAGSGRKFIFWNYIDSTGYTYPAKTYSRNVSHPGTWDVGAIDHINNSIELKHPWSGDVYLKGTEVSNSRYSNGYNYVAGSGEYAPKNWLRLSGEISGINYTGVKKTDAFPPGTRYADVGWLLNYMGNNQGDITYISDIRFEVVE